LNLFNKVINIDFKDENKNVIDKIVMEKDGQLMTGVPPNITISGKFLTATVVGELSLIIVNFYPNRPLNSYKYITITAGYYGSDLYATIDGIVTMGYQESPSPDGVTVISFLTSNLDTFLNTQLDHYFNEGESVRSVFQYITDQLEANSGGNKWNLNYNITRTPMMTGLSLSGTVKDAMILLKRRFNILYDISGFNLSVYDMKSGKADNKVEIKYVSSPPIVTAAGVTFTAPWLPNLRPGMKIFIDPKYFRQSFGASLIDTNKDLMVLNVTFAFNTITSQNNMIVLAINSDEA
jgi:hypothetical protein